MGIPGTNGGKGEKGDTGKFNACMHVWGNGYTKSNIV